MTHNSRDIGHLIDNKHKSMGDDLNEQQPNRTVFLIGATGGIGRALLQQLQQDKGVYHIFATYRGEKPKSATPDTISKTTWIHMDISDEASVIAGIGQISQKSSHLNWVINAAGLLHTDTHQPEKAISQLDPEFFMQNMAINALPSLFIAKHVKPLLKAASRSPANPAVFASISARVGSISDNQVGGWYSYRMSKAALNMGMKTLSIEWRRSLKDACVVVLQPGTVDTKLSEPFQRNVAEGKLFSPEFCASSLLKVLAGLTSDDTGSFLDWAGQGIGW